MPVYGRHPTAQILHHSGGSYLIDCGEGTQMQIADYKEKWSKITKIFISHLHGDHYFGLAGLLNTMALLKRPHPVDIYAPEGLEEIIKLQIAGAGKDLPYEITFHTVTAAGLISDDGFMQVNAFPTDHKITCFGYKFTQIKKPRSLDILAVQAAKVPISFYKSLQDGKDYKSADGNIISNNKLTIAGAAPKTYAYCADTRYCEAMLPHIQNADVIYHETTFLKDAEERAYERYHSTTSQAATIAKKANAGRLLIAHFSSKYKELDVFVEECKEVFGNVELALEGATYLL